MELKETKDGWVLTGLEQCNSCEGTGLYVGFAERDGASVVCKDCGGTGSKYVYHSFKKFDKRLKREGVKRVYKNGGGYVISAKDIKMEDGSVIRMSQFGVSYDDWLDGKKPIPIKDLLCPYQHKGQDMRGENDVNDLYKTRCSKCLRCGSTISDCILRGEMDKCWRIFDGEKI